MLNRLISLVFLLSFLNINIAYSETEFLFPQKKPSIFKKNKEQIQENISQNLPVPKPKIKEKISEVNKEKKVTEKINETQIKVVITDFIYPKKNQSHIKFHLKRYRHQRFLIKKISKKQKKLLNLLKRKNGIVP